VAHGGQQAGESGPASVHEKGAIYRADDRHADRQTMRPLYDDDSYACECQVEKCSQSGAMSRTIVAACLLTLLCLCCHLATANPDAKRLYDDLLKKKKYNNLMRPVADHKGNLTVKINVKLSQLIDVVSSL